MSGPTNPTEVYFDKGQWGFDGTLWRKLNLTWGYYDRYVEAKSELACVIGYNGLTFTAVPAGEVWKVAGMTWVNTITACGVIAAQLVAGGSAYNAYVEMAPAANGYKTILCDVTLKATDYLRFDFITCAAGDDIYAWVYGYKMKVA